jgi:hypothetical protein
MLGGLNSNFVLWITFGALAATALTLIFWGWKTFRGMEGMEKDANQ